MASLVSSRPFCGGVEGQRGSYVEYIRITDESSRQMNKPFPMAQTEAKKDLTLHVSSSNGAGLQNAEVIYANLPSIRTLN